MPTYPRREYHCRNCGIHLFSTRAAATNDAPIELVCPDRRCKRMNTYRLCDSDRPGNRRLFLERWQAERRLASSMNGVASAVHA